MNLSDVARGTHRLQGVQWMLSGVASRAALRSALGALVPASIRLGPLRLRRAVFRAGPKLRAYYDVGIHERAGAHTRSIAVTWRRRGHRDRRPLDGLAELEREAVRRGVAAPFARLLVEVPDWGAEIELAPLDRYFLQLVQLSDPRYVRELLAAVGGTATRGAQRYRVDTVRYYPGLRHVLRYALEGKPRTVFAKLYSGKLGLDCFRVAAQAADWLAGDGEGVSCARPLAYLAEHETVLYPSASGASLLQWLARPGAGRCLERAGRALQVLHRLPESAVGPLPQHDFAVEVNGVIEACLPMVMLLPSLEPAIAAVLYRALELHERLPKEPPTFTHGDFKTEHVWISARRLTLIDFDTAHQADPALDIGKLLADLQFWSSDPWRVERQQRRFLAGCGAPAPRLARARLYEALELTKMAARRAALAHHECAARARDLIGRAQAAMQRV